MKKGPFLKSKIFIVYFFLIIWTIFTLFPIFWMVTTSFKPKISVLTGPKYLPWIDFEPTSNWWGKIFSIEAREIFPPLINSAIIATISSVLATVLGMMAAYSLTRFKIKIAFMKNQDVLMWIVSQRMMPPIVVVLAIFIMFRISNLIDTHLGMILIYTTFNIPIAVWMMRNFLSQIPISTEEAAMVDGASRLQTFSKILIPMTWPSLAATFLLCFIFAWNEFLFALILTYNKTRTIPILIASQHFQRGPQWWDISVLSTIAIIPIIVIALSLQRYFIKGLIPIGK